MLDKHDRRLTAAERADHDRLFPALQVWTAYLDDMAAVGTFNLAAERGAPIVARHTAAAPVGGIRAPYRPLVVCPAWALAWAQRTGRLGAPGSGSVLTYGQLVDALDFMRADRAVTFRPAGEASGCRRREGFFHLPRETVARLRGAVYTPVLTARPGRPLSRPGRVAGGRTTRAIRHVDGNDHTLTIVRDWARVNPVTALLATAVDRGYPLATRPPGRPRTAAAMGAQVVTSHVLGRTDALATHAAQHADRLGIRIPSAGELRAALAALSADGSGIAPVTRLSTPDAPGRRNLRDWWRFALAPLGLPQTEPGDLLGEITHWEHSRDHPPAPLEPTRVIGGFVLPADAEPEYLDDPDYRLMVGVSDEDYERWKAGE